MAERHQYLSGNGGCAYEYDLYANNIPQDMAKLMESVTAEINFERNAMMLYPYIRKMRISHCRASEILGISNLDLIEYYNSMGLSYLNQSEEEHSEELETFRKLKENNSCFRYHRSCAEHDLKKLSI